MITNIQGNFYNYPKLELVYLDFADLTQGDYTAKKLKNTAQTEKTYKITEDAVNGEQIPFILNHPKSLKLKVETWYGQVIEGYIFESGKDPIPLKKIFALPAPVVFENGDATATVVDNIQVGY
jgi:hypothetical protein